MTRFIRFLFLNFNFPPQKKKSATKNVFFQQNKKISYYFSFFNIKKDLNQNKIERESEKKNNFLKNEFYTIFSAFICF